MSNTPDKGGVQANMIAPTVTPTTLLLRVGQEVAVEIDEILVMCTVRGVNQTGDSYQVNFVWPPTLRKYKQWVDVSEIQCESKAPPAVIASDDLKAQEKAQQAQLAASNKSKKRRTDDLTHVRQVETDSDERVHSQKKKKPAAKEKKNNLASKQSTRASAQPSSANQTAEQVSSDLITNGELIYYIVGQQLITGIVLRYAPSANQYAVRFEVGEEEYFSFLPASSICRIPPSHSVLAVTTQEPVLIMQTSEPTPKNLTGTQKKTAMSPSVVEDSEENGQM